MKNSCLAQTLPLFLLLGPAAATAQSSGTHDPTWWEKYQFVSKNGADPSAGVTSSTGVGKNVDVSNECGPQSETFITLDPNRPKILAAGSNEIFRLPMRGYFSTNDGTSWGGIDLPLPPPVPLDQSRFPSGLPSLFRPCPLLRARLYPCCVSRFRPPAVSHSPPG